MRDGVRGQALRYLVIGGLNTLVTYALFIGLGLVMDPGIAFTIAFLAGLVWVVFGSSRLVFRAAHSPLRLLAFAGFYLLVYAIGRLIVELIGPSDAISLALTSLAVLIVTTPVSFLGGRYIFTPTPASAPTAADQHDGA